MADQFTKLHIVMFPWSGFGHILNFLQLSKFIAQKGHKVSFLSTTRNIHRLPKTNLPSNLTFVNLTLPPVDGLPENAEATMDIGPTQIHYLMEAIDRLEPELSRFLETESPDWIIYDFTAYWVPKVAEKLGISRAFFATYNAWFMSIVGSSAEAMINDSDDARKSEEDWLVSPPWVPFSSTVRYRVHELNWVKAACSTQNASGVSMRFRMGSIIAGSDAIFVRDCNEFEPRWLSLLKDLHNKEVIPIGLMPPSPEDNRDDSNEKWLTMAEWLNSQPKKSVVYIALGSEVPLSRDQLTELALGLEQSELPFFWALRKPAGESEKSIELPDGFLERIKGRGMVWTSWAPQLKILSHDLVGGFLTHCGWGSIVEGLSFGHPLIMLPFFGDQGPNARVLVEKKLGIELPRDELNGSFTRNSVAESLSLVMVKDEGKIYRENANEISKISGDKELQKKYIDGAINFLESHRARATITKENARGIK